MDEVDIYEASARSEHAYREASVARLVEHYLVKHRAKQARQVNRSKLAVLHAKQVVVRGILAAGKRDATACRLVEAEQAGKRDAAMCILADTTREEMVVELLQHFARERDSQPDFVKSGKGIWMGKFGWVHQQDFTHAIEEDLARYRNAQPLKWRQMFPRGW